MRKEVIGLFLGGSKQIQISRTTGVCKASVGHIVRHFESTGKIAHEAKTWRRHEKYSMPKDTPFSMRKEVINLLLQGYKQSQISRTTGLSECTVSSIVQRFKSTGDISSL